MLESSVERRLRLEVEKLGGMACKLDSTGSAGMPDRLVLLPSGIVHFVELKRPVGGVLSKLQKYRICKLKEMGMNVHVIKSCQEVKTFIEEIQNDIQTT